MTSKVSSEIEAVLKGWFLQIREHNTHFELPY